ncbi:MAG: anti-sigma F factor [Christensenellales bacterium]|jgi:stage II sporulation protein AB (anti-sigma F factor)
MDNKMTLTFKAIEENLGFARSVVGAFCVAENPTIDILSDIKTAVSEAVTNAIVHAYKGNQGEVVIEAEIIDHTLFLTVKDSGCGIENVEMALKDFYTSSSREERSGLGFTIMRSFMDSLNVLSKPFAGTTVLMKKQLA